MISSYKVVGELPGSGPWRIATFAGTPVFVSPEVGAYMLIDGKLCPVDCGSATAEMLTAEAPKPLPRGR